MKDLGMLINCKKIIYSVFFFVFAFNSFAMEKDGLIQICKDGVCKWIPIKEVLTAPIEAQENSKKILSSTLGFIADHPKGSFYCLCGGLGLTALACFAYSDLYWQTPEYLRKSRRLRLENFLKNKNELLSLHSDLIGQIKRFISDSAAQYGSRIKEINDEVENFGQLLKEQHKTTLVTDRAQTEFFEKEQDKLLDDVEIVLVESVEDSRKKFLELLKMKQNDLEQLLDFLAQRQRNCRRTLYTGVEKYCSLQRAFQSDTDAIYSVCSQQVEKATSSHEKEQEAVGIHLAGIHAQLKNMQSFLHNSVNDTEKEVTNLSNSQAEMQSSLFAIKQSIGMVPTSPGGFPG